MYQILLMIDLVNHTIPVQIRVLIFAILRDNNVIQRFTMVQKELLHYAYHNRT